MKKEDRVIGRVVRVNVSLGNLTTRKMDYTKRGPEEYRHRSIRFKVESIVEESPRKDREERDNLQNLNVFKNF